LLPILFHLLLIETLLSSTEEVAGDQEAEFHARQSACVGAETNLA
jgi:hypothetical protein